MASDAPDSRALAAQECGPVARVDVPVADAPAVVMVVAMVAAAIIIDR
jgi:hypothetical protein